MILLKREIQLERIYRNINKINVESGLGASGIPHIGSLGDAVTSIWSKNCTRRQTGINQN